MNDFRPVNTPMEMHTHSTPLLPNEEGYNIEEYRSIIGTLIYAAVLTRPDIATAVGFLARHMQKPRITHWNVLQWVLRYLKGTINYGLVYYHHISNDNNNNHCDIQIQYLTKLSRPG